MRFPTRSKLFVLLPAASLLCGSMAAAEESSRLPAYAWDEPRVLLETSFEPGDPELTLPRHQRTEATARTGRHAIVGEVPDSDRAVVLEVPFDARQGEVVHLWFWVVSNKRSACTTFAKVGDERIRLSGQLRRIPVNRWSQVHAFYRPEEDVTGVFQIAAPTSYNAPPGKVWIDDITVLAARDDCRWPKVSADFPAMARDKSGTIWLATLESPLPKRHIRIEQVDDGLERRSVATLESPDWTGVGAPAIAGLDRGCVVVFPAEEDDRWRIWYAFVRKPGHTPRIREIASGGTANIAPAVAAAGDRAWVAWESNADGARRILACELKSDAHEPIQRLSLPDVNSYNPALVMLPNGTLHAAWDSLRDHNSDIYGAWRRDGDWLPEERITHDPRIERHASLATRNGELWLAWQAQSFGRPRPNDALEQRIAVARFGNGRLSAPKGLFEKISTPDRMLLRPRILLDQSGRLWLTARQSVGQHAGWQPVAWCYAGDTWSDPCLLMYQPGRWRPVATVPGASQPLAACQFDEIPNTGGARGKNPEWRSGVVLKHIPDIGPVQAAELVLEPLAFPATRFSLADYADQNHADLPRQVIEHGGETLTLWWGTLHNHTDLSICARSTNAPGHDLYANERDIERADFCAITDHGFDFDTARWLYNGEQTRMNHDPGRFVTFLGQEWTSSSNPPVEPGRPNRYGHHNLVYLDPYYDRYHDAFDGNISPADLWNELSGVEFICIPHQLADWEHKGKGNPPTDWSFTDERLQPLAEIFQARGSYECYGCPRQARKGAPFPGFYLQDAWARGIVIGTIASPDHGGGKGRAGVWAEELTRESIFRALQARHTFGTSGAKMSLLFRTGEAMMGDKVRANGQPVTFQVQVVAGSPIREAVILRNNEVAFREKPGQTRCDLTWTDTPPSDRALNWYYARIHTEDDELAWSSPIWFVGP